MHMMSSLAGPSTGYVLESKGSLSCTSMSPFFVQTDFPLFPKRGALPLQLSNKRELYETD